MTIKQFDRAVCGAIAKEIENDLQALAKKHGLQIRAAGGSFGLTNYTMKLELSVIGSDGEVQSREAEAFKQSATFYGLAPEDLGREFTYQGSKYKLVGLRPSARKMPFICLRSDGRMMKFPTLIIRSLLAKGG